MTDTVCVQGILFFCKWNTPHFASSLTYQWLCPVRKYVILASSNVCECNVFYGPTTIGCCIAMMILKLWNIILPPTPNWLFGTRMSPNPSSHSHCQAHLACMHGHKAFSFPSKSGLTVRHFCPCSRRPIVVYSPPPLSSCDSKTGINRHWQFDRSELQDYLPAKRLLYDGVPPLKERITGGQINGTAVLKMIVDGCRRQGLV